jgi:hypothetical protein
VKSANIKIIGHFNPSILRHEFLVNERRINPGQFHEESPKEAPVVSEIKYRDSRWFMDFQNFMLEQFNLNEFDAFLGVKWALQYFSVLKYTPVIVAGLNFHSVFEIDDLDTALSKLSDMGNLTTVMHEITPFVNVETTQRFMKTENKQNLMDLSIRYPDHLRDLPIQHLLTVTIPEDRSKIEIAFNLETQRMSPLIKGLEALVELGENRSEFGESLFFKLIGVKT